MSISTLKKRREFSRVRGGRRCSTAAFLIECKARPYATPKDGRPADGICEQKSFAAKVMGPRFGFTITKKLGNAVVRNRIRRRLKAALDELAPQLADPAYDYVILARKAAFNRKFANMKHDMRTAFQRLHTTSEKQSDKSGHRPRRRDRSTSRQSDARPGNE